MKITVELTTQDVGLIEEAFCLLEADYEPSSAPIKSLLYAHIERVRRAISRGMKNRNSEKGSDSYD